MARYTTYYGFSEDPFAIAPDPKFYFPSAGHSEALASLHYGISQKKGFVLLLGETGIGKTLLIHHLIGLLDRNIKTIFIPHGQIPFDQILREMLHKSGLSTEAKTKGAMIHDLYSHLIGALERDETVSVIIDDAENIGLEVIEEVRLLANLETSTAKLLQIVLAGQPALREKLRSDVIRQIKQRIVISYHIKPLTEEESLLYIDHRLKIAGSSSSGVFTAQALSQICRQARGIPLALNILCSNALSVGSALAEKKISRATVKSIAGEKAVLTKERVKTIVSGSKRSVLRKVRFAAAAFALLAVALFFGWPYAQSLFHGLKPTPSGTETAIRETFVAPRAAEAPRVEAKPPVAAGNVPDSPDPKSAVAALQKPSIPAPPTPAPLPLTPPAPVPPTPAAAALPPTTSQVPVPTPAIPATSFPTPETAATLPPVPLPKPAAPVLPAPAPPAPAQPASALPSGAMDGTIGGIVLKDIAEAKPGTNLYALAYRYYREAGETFIDHILKVNPEIVNIHLILVNQKIKIPEVTESLLIVPSAGLYRLHLKTFAHLPYAVQYRQSESLKGKPIEIIQWKVAPGETWYRVMAGPFGSRKDAVAAMKGFGLP